jgi:hypothetical protein
MRAVILPVVLAALLSLVPGVGQAAPYKWCAQYGGFWGGGGRNCGFVTYQQCMATVSGIGGFCEPNQFYTGRETTGSGSRSKKKVRHAD